MKNKSRSVPASGPPQQQDREGTNQLKKTEIKRSPRQLSADQLHEIARRMVSTNNPTRAAKLKTKYMEGFYGKRLKDVRRIQRKSQQ